MILRKDIVVRDPFVFKEDDMYYLYASRHFKGDEYPCFVCFRSKDLENFEEPVVIFRGGNGFWGTKDYWAPELHKYNGKYYLFASFKAENKARATHILVSDRPDGVFTPISENPPTPSDWESLDGTLFIENGKPYMVFCHEWLQIDDGEICAVELSSDLTHPVSEPVVLFRASSLKWIRPIVDKNYNTKPNSYVTDGPFLFKRNGKLNMIWSTYSENGYSVVLSKANSLFDKWIHDDTPLYSKNGGHGMVFEKDNSLKITFHYPNSPNGAERMIIGDFDQLERERI